MRLPPLEVLYSWPDPNYVDPVTRGSALLIVNCVFVYIAVLFVGAQSRRIGPVVYIGTPPQLPLEVAIALTSTARGLEIRRAFHCSGKEPFSGRLAERLQSVAES